jgi:hypothetical protein
VSSSNPAALALRLTSFLTVSDIGEVSKLQKGNKGRLEKWVRSRKETAPERTLNVCKIIGGCKALFT